jgi:hypothetical protein
MTCAPAGIFTDAPAPTAEIFPFSITTNAVLNHSMRDGQNLPALQDDGFRLRGRWVTCEERSKHKSRGNPRTEN